MIDAAAALNHAIRFDDLWNLQTPLEATHKTPRPITMAKLTLILSSICRFHSTVVGNTARITSERDE